MAASVTPRFHLHLFGRQSRQPSSTRRDLDLVQTLCRLHQRWIRLNGRLRTGWVLWQQSWTSGRTPLHDCPSCCFRAKDEARARPHGLTTGHPCLFSRFRQITGTDQGSRLCPWGFSPNRLALNWQAAQQLWNTIGREHTWEREASSLISPTSLRGTPHRQGPVRAAPNRRPLYGTSYASYTRPGPMSSRPSGCGKRPHSATHLESKWCQFSHCRGVVSRREDTVLRQACHARAVEWGCFPSKSSQARSLCGRADNIMPWQTSCQLPKRERLDAPHNCRQPNPFLHASPGA